MIKSFMSKSIRTLDLSKVFTCLALAYSISLTPAYSQQIIIDGNTQTTLNTVGTTTNVTTTTTQGVNAFNSFTRFNVNQGNTVNLVVPNASERLINIIRGETSNINGTLNSIKNGVAGGNIYLVNPHGLIVGSQGSINAQALTIVTPTQQFADNFFTTPGNPNDASVTALINGTAPINPDAAVNNAGHITGQTKVEINSGTMTNSGTIELGDLVNVEELDNGQVVGYYNGDVLIRCEGNITNSGIINVAGADNLDGGYINLAAKGDVLLESVSLLSAAGLGVNSDGGTINLTATNNVILSSGLYNAGSAQGTAGTVNITGNNISIRSNQYSYGANLNYIITGDGNLSNINCENPVISSRKIQNILTGDHTSDQSTGNSGNITFTGKQAELRDGIKILAKADNGFTGGNITLDCDIFNGLGSVFDTDRNVTFNFLNNLEFQPGGYENDVPTSLPQIFAGGTLTINAKDINKLAYFNLDLDTVNAGALSSNIIAQNQPIDITLNPSIQYTFLTLGNLDNFLIAGNPLNPTSISLNAKSVKLNGNITTAGNIVLNGSFVELRSGTTINASNVILNPLLLLQYYGGSINCNNLLTINGGDIAHYGIFFTPTSINTGAFNSDFITPNANLTLNTINDNPIPWGYIDFGNIDKFKINNQPLNLNNVSITNFKTLNLIGDTSISGDFIASSPLIYTNKLNLNAANITFNGTKTSLIYEGNISTTGTLNITGSDIEVGDKATLNAKNITVNPSNYLKVYNSTINASSNLTINGGDILNNGIVFAPSSINTLTFNSDFIKPGQPLTLTSTGIVEGDKGWISIGHFDNFKINNQQIQFTGLNITCNKGISLLGEIPTSGFFEVYAPLINLYGVDINADNITLDASKSLFISGGDINTPGTIILNSKDMSEDSFSLSANSITTGSLISNFLHQNQPLNITCNRQIWLSNLDKILINDSKLNLTDINIINPDNINGITLSGEISTSGNININNYGPIYIIPEHIVWGVNGIVVDTPAPIINARNIIFEAGEVIFKDATLNAGNYNTDLLIVNNNSTIDPLSNIPAEIYNNNVNVPNFSTSGNTINIKTGFISGSNSTLTVPQGQRNLTITNNSNKDLHLNSLGMPGINSDIYVNGKRVINDIISPDGTIKVVYQDTGIQNQQMNITNNSTSNIILNNSVANTFGPINITNTGGSILKEDFAAIYSYFPTLSAANGNIGSLDKPIVFWATGDPTRITATAKGLISLYQPGNLWVNSINSTAGDVILTSTAGILDISPDQNANVIANNIILNAPNDSSIGVFNDPLDITLNGGSIKALGYGLINLRSVNSDLTIDEISNKGRADVILTSSGNISDIHTNTTTPAIQCYNLSLYATDGDQIGLANNPLDIDMASLPSASLLALGGKDIYIKQLNGALYLNAVSNAGNGTVSLEAPLYIHDASSWEEPNIFAKDIILKAQYGVGNVGAPFGPVDIAQNYNTTGGTLTATAQNVNISQTGGNLYINKIDTKTTYPYTSYGDVRIKSDSGILNQGDGIIAKNIYLDATKDSSIGLYDTPLKLVLADHSYLTAFGFGLINILANGGTLSLDVISNSGRGDVIINSQGSIVDGQPGEMPNIYGRNINLTSNGSIGTSIDALDLALNYKSNGGKLTARADYDIAIGSSNGDLLLESVTSNIGNVSLFSTGGSILDTTSTQPYSITGADVKLVALKKDSTIGTDNDPLDTNLTIGWLNAQAYGNINIFEHTGIMPIELVSNSGRGDVKLTADKGFSSKFTYYSTIYIPCNIYTRGLELIANQGDIGDPDLNRYPLRIITNYKSTGGSLTAITPDGNINIGQVEGDLYLNTVTSTKDVKLASKGSIYTPTVLPVINVTGNNLNLGAAVNIGTQQNPIELKANGTVTVTGSGNKFYHEN